MVAALYASGFISGAISASFAGQLADRYGRRLACLLYCVFYILTCLSMLSNDFLVLFAGRLCGGVSTTLLFSVFEAWMITEYHGRGLQGSGLTLGTIFGYMTTMSCIVAIACGVVGDILVAQLGGRVWPFMASAGCAAVAGYYILTTWVGFSSSLLPISRPSYKKGKRKRKRERGKQKADRCGQRENYGAKSTEQSSFEDVKSGIMTVLANKRVLALGVTSCFFEGAMYLMIFFWSAALKSARTKAGGSAADGDDLPFGLIFSSFMCAMMAGSAGFSLFAAHHTKETTSFLLMAVILVVSACLSAAAVLENESLLFWAFCVFEACIGTYFPSMSYLKSEVVEDGVRGRVYSILRFPLNVFVVVVHSLDSEGTCKGKEPERQQGGRRGRCLGGLSTRYIIAPALTWL